MLLILNYKLKIIESQQQVNFYNKFIYKNKQQMGKEQERQAAKAVQKQKNKSHKTLRQKLRKKRLNQKQHLKQKKQKRKQFNPQQQKKQFFYKHFNSSTEDKYKQAKKQFKYKKIHKYIQKFINIYQDDLEDFFVLFKEFDQGGFIDISGLENKKLHKVLLKLFKYLPLNMTTNNQTGQEVTQYRKKKESTLNLQNVIRNLVAQSVQNYMQNGTEDEMQQKSQQEDSSQNQENDIKAIKKDKNNKKVNVNIRTEQQGVFTLPKPSFQVGPSFGPCIPAEQRQKIAQMFQKQLQDMQGQKQYQDSIQNDKFQEIFSMGKAVNKLKNPPKQANKSVLQDIPQHLLAQGSARIGQKVTINDQQQQQYDAIHRPRKLIEEHREIMAINQGDPEGVRGNGRKSFDYQRDIANSRNKLTVDNIKNGVFFDFKDKMSAPKKTNNFL